MDKWYWYNKQVDFKRQLCSGNVSGLALYKRRNFNGEIDIAEMIKKTNNKIKRWHKQVGLLVNQSWF